MPVWYGLGAVGVDPREYVVLNDKLCHTSIQNDSNVEPYVVPPSLLMRVF